MEIENRSPTHQHKTVLTIQRCCNLFQVLQRWHQPVRLWAGVDDTLEERHMHHRHGGRGRQLSPILGCSQREPPTFRRSILRIKHQRFMQFDIEVTIFGNFTCRTRQFIYKSLPQRAVNNYLGSNGGMVGSRQRNI